MKPSISPAAVAAIATAAFFAHNPDYGQEPDPRYPERVLEDPFGLQEEICLSYSAKPFDLAVIVYDRALALGLQVGARIGADPLHLPDIKDLLAEHRLTKRPEAA